MIIREPSVRILNYAQYLKHSKPKRALLSYLSQPILDELTGGTSVRFSNDGLATSWPKVLNKLGYSVDIINWDDNDFTFEHSYQLIISHGGINYDNIARQMGESRYIYFSTGSYWKFHNQQEQKRFKDFERRHKTVLPNDRFIDHPEEAANRRADAIICLGNKAAAETYEGFENVYNLPVGSFTGVGHEKTHAEIEAGRKNILFIAGAGNIHKGLDLLLDAIADMPDFILHIYTFLDPEFVRFYKKQLNGSNVIIHEFEAFPSEKFLAITKICNIAIMPSCSEGSPGSIVEAMIQGLIPIVSQEAHIDVDGAGIVLKENTIQAIHDALRSVSTANPEELVKFSHIASTTGLNNHSRQVFEKTLTGIVKRFEKTEK